MNTFADKIVVVSGAGKGIGKGIALAFANEGATVVVCDKSADFLDNLSQEFKQIGHKYQTELVDIAKPEEIDQFVKVVTEKFGHVDVLVNNAGFGLAKKIEQTSLEDMDNVWNTNFRGTFYLTKQLLPLLKSGSSITFMSSIHSEQPSLDPSYDSSKNAINSLMLNLSLGLAKKGIRVNAVAPGHIDVVTNDQPREQLDVMLGKKAGLPADIAEAVLFLSDNTKARYITGIILPVTGGLHIHIARDIEF